MRTPKEIVEFTYQTSETKRNLPLNKLAILSILAGIYISMGGLLSVMVGFGVPELSASNPAIAKLLMGLTFPIGLALITLLGAELFTGNCATLIPSAMRGETLWAEVLKNWSLVWLGNFVGALFFAYLMVYLTGALHISPWVDSLKTLAVVKTSQSFFVIFVKGIGANWFVCLAVWAAISVKEPLAKLVALWFPVATFVVIGYEHSIANMFFIPIAMLEGADVTISQFVFNNLIPSTLGNVFGGAIFVGCVYGYIYGTKK